MKRCLRGITRLWIVVAALTLLAGGKDFSAYAMDCAMGCAKDKQAAAAQPAAKADKNAFPYPLGTCLVSGDKLGDDMGKPVIYDYKGREIRFCCPDCIENFNKEPAKYLKTLDKAVIKQQKASYPLQTCVVSGQKIGAMGKGVDYVYKNRLVRFCCSDCIKTFDKDPAKYLAKIDQARKDKSAKDKQTAAK